MFIFSLTRAKGWAKLQAFFPDIRMGTEPDIRYLFKYPACLFLAWPELCEGLGEPPGYHAGYFNCFEPDIRSFLTLFFLAELCWGLDDPVGFQFVTRYPDGNKTRYPVLIYVFCIKQCLFLAWPELCWGLGELAGLHALGLPTPPSFLHQKVGGIGFFWISV